MEWVTNQPNLSFTKPLHCAVPGYQPGRARRGDDGEKWGCTLVLHLTWTEFWCSWCAASWSQLGVCLSMFFPFVPALVLQRGTAAGKLFWLHALEADEAAVGCSLVGQYHSYEDRLALQRSSSASCWLPKGVEFVFESCTESMAEGQAAAWR